MSVAKPDAPSGDWRNFLVTNQFLYGLELAPLILLERQKYLIAMALIVGSFVLHQTNAVARFLVAKQPWLWWHFYLICPIAYAIVTVAGLFLPVDVMILVVLAVVAVVLLLRIYWSRPIFLKTYNMKDN